MLLEMAKDLVVASTTTYRLSPDDARALLVETHATLVDLNRQEDGTPLISAANSLANPPAWQRSITKHAVICLACGATFKQLSSRHLRRHGLDPRSYRVRYGIPRTQALSARTVTARRRQLARDIRPWEKAHSMPSRAKPANGRRKRTP
ncbi:MAG: hypothetical protein ETSY1_41150 [Candidatus Entotheonella factor]|uniref:MucR family transcriptional regulator n=1 Tax=Entotheonella factor TaxID=1429438 RepID=W4L4G9_ENTF1|nr:MAG: hypothetical protein ETSY1_41150 [Candidatus Entotheonella factor]